MCLEIITGAQKFVLVFYALLYLYSYIYSLSTLLFVRWKAVGPMVLADCQGVHSEGKSSLFVLPDTESSYHHAVRH